ncbi:MAG: hypothetical protein ING90_01295 [Rhodocyclaceae bacterium]|jgi:tetratricopeptide (TPR) repeat protein|nr:hypothetical protein [Rhodocyclaceae bacterium]MCE2979293.1 hypothetical protein [Betaproteobacteria bacterium]MCA3073886.1 hypothetical protein [Rhodocyclaceae bacterium]MCA3089257.1 hypothetical protein [Rhodocyclaceae bacterium]MCA3092818.1 hypothetical protein [Rhodocyclaceae bacterium]
MRSALFDHALRLVVSRPPVPAARTVTERRLADLFCTLASTDDLVVAGEAEDTIWALWTSHDEPELEQRLDRAIHHIAAREFEPAEGLLDALLADRDDYVEAWNKRATLYFLMERDRESVADIVRTLELEPRHFGAICGFAQICLRHGRRAEALAAFETALAINPHMAGPRSAVDALNAEFRSTAH